jgi:glycogen debranching enzyme
MMNTSPENGNGFSGDQPDPYVLHGSASTSVEKITLKHGDAFLVADARGDLPESEQETGLYWHGTRFLRTCDVFLTGQPLIPLSHSISDEEGTCQIDLTNPFLRIGKEIVYQGTIHVRRLLVLRGHELKQWLILTSFHEAPIALKLGLRLGADFRDIFEVRGLPREKRGQMRPARVDREGVALSYLGLDNITRETHVQFSPPAAQAVMQGLFWDLHLEHGQTVEVSISTTLETTGEQPMELERADLVPREQLPHGAELPLVRTNNVFFNRMLTRGMHDLEMMCANTPHGLFPYAGIPWYVCPFGRDALITGIEFLPWFPQIARGTLNFLAAYQGTKVVEFTEEEPGRIREMANCREVPFIPYYGTVDATPLFIILLEHYVRWTDDLAFLRQMWPHAQAAATWMQTFGDIDHDGFLEYAKMSDKGLVNQGWKDSWDAVSYADGQLAKPPIALCEVQGYAYAAYLALRYLARRLGLMEDAAHWEMTAAQHRENVLRHFWWPEEDCFYMALDGDKRPCNVVTSNAGQCLWTGIVPDDRAEAVIARMMRDDMYTEWGIRTLSTRAQRYNPMSYHGTRGGRLRALRPPARGRRAAGASLRRQPALSRIAAARALLRFLARWRLRPHALSSGLLAAVMGRRRALPDALLGAGLRAGGRAPALDPARAGAADVDGLAGAGRRASGRAEAEPALRAFADGHQRGADRRDRNRGACGAALSFPHNSRLVARMCASRYTRLTIAAPLTSRARK